MGRTVRRADPGSAGVSLKVVLFCGGLGLRLREYAEVPKPMVLVGQRPILWHLMKYYAHYGHRDFICCLGYRADAIRAFFQANHDADVAGWRVTFVDTGLETTIGGRLMAARGHVNGEAEFLANYTDVLSDVDLPALIGGFRRSGAIGGFLAVRPNTTAHFVTTDGAGMVDRLVDAAGAGIWTNGGYFMFRQEIFDHVRDGEELVDEPFRRLIDRKRLYAHKHRGFWTSMDTFKEKQQLDALHARGERPWEVWRPGP